jgi:hypothetical protein
MNIIIYIIAYLLLTGLAIYFSQDEGVFDGVGFMQSFVRISSLMLIGWLVALLIAIGATVGYAGVFLADNFLKYRSEPFEGQFSLLHWVGREIKILLKLIIPKRKKKEEAESCPTDANSQTEQQES